MPTNKTTDRLSALSLAIYFACGLLLLPFYRYQINPDGISYLDIARTYLSGDISQAVTGFWSPLYSWLLIPFLAVDLPGLLAAKLLALVLGGIALTGIRTLAGKLELTRETTVVLPYLFIPFLIYCAFSTITPDLLSVCLLLFYLSAVFDSDCSTGKSIAAGLIGGLGYLSKAYIFPFFIVHFFVLNLIHVLNRTTGTERHQAILRFFFGLAAFLLVSGPWIGILSAKYHTLTISSAGSYNFAMQSPNANLQPIHCRGFFAPPYPGATSVWTDPSGIRLESWNPIRSASNTAHLLRRSLNNARAALIVLVEFSFLSLLILISCIPILLAARPGQLLRQPVFYAFLTVIIYTMGYTPFHIEPRYLWLVYCLLFLMGGALLSAMFRARPFSSVGRHLCLALLAGSFCLYPGRQLCRYAGAGRDVCRLGTLIRSCSGITGNVASDSQWNLTLYLCYHANARYYGVMRPGISASELEQALKENKIAYFFVWDARTGEPAFLRGHREITGGRIGNLRIYAMEQPAHSNSSRSIAIHEAPMLR